MQREIDRSIDLKENEKRKEGHEQKKRKERKKKKENMKPLRRTRKKKDTGEHTQKNRHVYQYTSSSKKRYLYHTYKHTHMRTLAFTHVPNNNKTNIKLGGYMNERKK